MRSAYKVKVMSVEEFRDNVSSKCEADSAVVLPPALLIRFYNQLLSVREGFSKKRNIILPNLRQEWKY